MGKINRFKTIVAKGKYRVSRKAVNLALFFFIIAIFCIILVMTMPTVEIPTWIMMTPLFLGFALLIYDSLV